MGSTRWPETVALKRTEWIPALLTISNFIHSYIYPFLNRSLLNYYYVPVHTRCPAVSQRDTGTLPGELPIAGSGTSSREVGCHAVVGRQPAAGMLTEAPTRTGGTSESLSRPREVHTEHEGCFSSGKMRGLSS